MNKIKKFIQNLKNNNNNNDNDNDNDIKNIYIELNNINYEQNHNYEYNLNYEQNHNYEYNLNYDEQKKMLIQEKMINYNMWINKMETEKKISDNDYKIMSKILLNEAYKNNKEDILKNLDEYNFLFENYNSIHIRNILNNFCLFGRKKQNLRENIET